MPGSGDDVIFKGKNNKCSYNNCEETRGPFMLIYILSYY